MSQSIDSFEFVSQSFLPENSIEFVIKIPSTDDPPSYEETQKEKPIKIDETPPPTYKDWFPDDKCGEPPRKSSDALNI